MMKRLFFLIAGLFFLLCAIIFGGIRHGWEWAETPVQPVRKEFFFLIPPGEPFHRIMGRLEAEGIVPDAFRMKWLARFLGVDTRIRAGEYLLTADMTPVAMLTALADGRVYLRRLTIPEGYTASQIARLAQDAGICDFQAFRDRVASPDAARENGVPGNSLEGYLFPDTYYFPKDAGAKVIIDSLISRFREVYSEEWRQQTVRLGTTVHEIVTLASIIEKETGAPEERRVIASVFYNRLRSRMKLQSDPTVIYGLTEFDGNLTRKHLDTTTPYNTYCIDGLPPGPIASPGREALMAALYPAETPYFYFVSKGDNTHYFSTTLSEHLRAVRKYRTGGRDS